jgi:hypothetical protein
MIDLLYKNFYKYNLNLYKISIVIFTLVYLPHVFILNNDLGLIIGYEIDPGSIIISIENHLNNYNLHNSYHSKFYGWTYFFLNFLVLAPLKFILLLLGIETKFIIYFSIRLLFFLLGLYSVIIFYNLNHRIFQNNAISFISTILYIFSPVGFHFFYFIHPEIVGSLFLFLGLFYLFKFSKKQKYKFYFISASFLILSSLSKQIFFFLSLPVFFCFFHTYCVKFKKKYSEFLLTKTFLNFFFITVTLAIIILFIIHPFALIEFKKFIEYQLFFFSFVNSEYTFSLSESISRWLKAILEIPPLFLMILFLPIMLAVSFYNYKVKLLNFYFNTLVVAIFVILLLIIFLNRFLIQVVYFSPLYPFLILALMGSLNFFLINKNSLSPFFITIFIVFIFFNFIFSIYYSFPKMINRFFYKDSLAYKTYEYNLINITKSDRLVYDHYISVPTKLKVYSCHFWQGCGEINTISLYDPNIIIFNEDWKVNGKITKETKTLIKYIKNNNFYLKAKIFGTGGHNYSVTGVSIYKKK